MVKKWSGPDQNFLALISYISIRVIRNKRGESVEMSNIYTLVLNHYLVCIGRYGHILYAPSPRPGLAWPLLLLLGSMLLSGCNALMSKATGGMASNLSAAILNQDDPETVRVGIPAYLIMLDSFVAGAPDDVALLTAAAELYAAYGVVFVDDPERAKRLTRRSWDYGQRALCSANVNTCGMASLHLQDMETVLDTLDKKDCEPLYTYGLSWLAYIQAHADEADALVRLPQAAVVMSRTQELDPDYRPGQVEMYLAILNTIRPPALGGNFSAGRVHYERAIEITNGRDLSIQVAFARYYARPLYDRELHDRILKKVLMANPVEPSLTLTNTLAQREARILLNNADDYF